MLHLHVCFLRRRRIHSIVLVFHFDKYMLLRIFDIKTLLWYSPTIPGMFEKVLMEISNLIGIRFINLPDALVFNCFLYRLTIYFRIESQFNRIYDIIVKLLQRNFTTVRFHRAFNMFIDILI